MGIYVKAKDQAGNEDPTPASRSFTVSLPPLTVTSLTPDKAAPQPVGTTITFTATATGGTAPHSYKWWFTTDNWKTWSLLRDWGGNSYAWAPCAPGNYQVGVWTRSSGNSANSPEAIAGVPFDILPTVVGTYSGSGALTESACAKSAYNATFPITASLTFTSQTSSSFTGTGTVITGFVDQITVTGTIDAAGQVSGTYTFITYAGGTPIWTGSGSFTGSLTGNTLSVTFSGQIQTGETCLVAGSLTVMR